MQQTTPYKPLVIDGLTINRNEYGFFDAKQMHACAGNFGPTPASWLRRIDVEKACQSFINKGYGSPVLYDQEGSCGVYLSREFTLFYSSAINEEFFVKTVRAFDDMMLESCTPAGKRLYTGGYFIGEQPAASKVTSDDGQHRINNDILDILKKLKTNNEALEKFNNELHTRVRILEQEMLVLLATPETGNATAQDFWDAFNEINDGHGDQQPYNHSNYKKTEIAINLYEALNAARHTGIDLPSRREVLHCLKKQPGYRGNKVIRSRLTGKPLRCLIFNRV